jgi:hypothetical protein
MSRDGVTVAAGNALAGENVPLLCFIELQFGSGTVRVCNAAYNFSWDSYTWIGAGQVLGVSGVEEGADLQAYGVTMRLSGVPAAYVSVALNEHYQGRTAKIWAAPLDSSYTIIADPVLVFNGRMDVMPIRMDGGSAVIELSIESRLIDWERPRVRRYNDADQQAEYPGDLGLQYVEQMVSKDLIWGRG